MPHVEGGKHVKKRSGVIANSMHNYGSGWKESLVRSLPTAVTLKSITVQRSIISATNHLASETNIVAPIASNKSYVVITIYYVG